MNFYNVSIKGKNMPFSFCPPDFNCDKCPRLVNYRKENKIKFPNYHNAPVESFGNLNAQILVVGLAPGLNGANQTNRPFTNDYAGDVLYPSLKKFGFAKGEYKKIKNDGFELINVRVSNAVRCVPPQNKVTTEETKNCSQFLIDEISNLRLKKTTKSITVEQVQRKIDKDRYSALAYALYYVFMFLEKNEQEEVYDEEDDIIYF